MNRSIDFWLITVTAILTVLGLVMVYSASAVVAGEWGDEMRFLTRQLISVAAGLMLCGATAFTPTRMLRRYRHFIYTAVMVGLVLTYVPGIQHSANGAERWIGFGSINLQPSEFAKIAVLLSMAHFLDRYRGVVADWRVVLGASLLPLPVMLLVIGQPDFGTTAIIGGLCAIMLFVAGLRHHFIAGIGLLGSFGAVALVMSAQYRMDRITSFTDPWASEKAEGYHTIQSWVAMHSGGLWGQGLGNSMAKLHFLPEPWTDYIAAVIAEELGLVRLVLIIMLFGLFVWRGLVIARRAKDAFGMFLASTLTAMIGFEAFFNLAVVMGMVPPKGLVLPFISYGASAMIANLWAVGVLLSIAAEGNEVEVSEGWPQRGLAARTPTIASGA
ncbi:MAG: putative lipid II flippase FtsW [Deltaproteobacteria bacterium]|nr:putative lipid II flippase FtsW [Deltaproteobacteria bacterium]HCH62491.1 putative lipid II flippase FtsW [Deltaproteobacteria bacterium]